MGQARQRGSREERVAAAVQKKRDALTAGLVETARQQQAAQDQASLLARMPEAQKKKLATRSRAELANIAAVMVGIASGALTVDRK